LKVMRDGRPVTVEVTTDGAGLVSHAGSFLLAQVADRLGLTGALSRGLAGLKQRQRGHDSGRVIRDLVVMLADGGECVSDLGGVREQEGLFGEVASDSTAYRLIEKIAREPGMLEVLRRAHARAREHFWEQHGAPEHLTIDVDATLVTVHSEKEKAAGNYKGGFGFHPLAAYADETREALGGVLRAGNAGSNTTEDHKTVLDLALCQIPREHIEGIKVLVRCDTAGATHGLAEHCREHGMRFSVGYELTEPVRAAILQIPDDAWVPALAGDGSQRKNGQVAEITSGVELSSWPDGSRLIVRRERPHPGAQLSFTDHDGHRFQAILTDQPDENIAEIECRHRQHAHVEDRIRDDKDTGLSKFPFKEFALNEVWLEIVMLAHDLIVWAQTLLLEGELAKAEPKRLRYTLLHLAARLAFHGRRAKLHLQSTWPWASELLAAFHKLRALPAPAG
jgi:Transposase DDE domain group 1